MSEMQILESPPTDGDQLDALLIMPPYWDVYGDIDVEKMGFLLPSLGIQYISSYLKSKGLKVKLMDIAQLGRGLDDIIEVLQETNPRFVGITCVTASMSTVLIVCKMIREVCPNAKIVLGGPHPSALPDETLEYEDVDYVVRGEGELTMHELCIDKPLDSINGLYYKTPEGEPRKNAPRELIEDLDTLPFADYEDLPLETYGYLMLGNALPILSSRGCPFLCTFCSSMAVNTRKMRTRTAKDFVDEIEHLQKNYGVDNFVFCDDTFTAHQSRTLELCQEIIDRKLEISWSAMIRASKMKLEVLEKMKESGCRMVEIGAESGDEYVLEMIHKYTKPYEITETIANAKKAGLIANAFFILGLPYDTPESIERTIRFASTSKLDYAQFSMFTPLPGSDDWERAREGKIVRNLARSWADYGRYNGAIVESDALPAAKLNQLHRKAIRRFYWRPSLAVKLLLKARSFSELMKLVHAGFSVLKLSAPAFLKGKKEAKKEPQGGFLQPATFLAQSARAESE